MLQKIGPPINFEKLAVPPKLIVNEPNHTLKGAKIPFKVACAEIAKIMKTTKALIFPVPVKTINREIQPLVNTIPAPNIIPPNAIVTSGISELKNL
jgi:hypothetical protein